MPPPNAPFIDGAPRASSGAGAGSDADAGARLPIINPATEDTWTEVASATADDVDRAVRGAHRAFEQDWRDLAPGRRAEILFAVTRLIREHTEELAQLDMRSVGKPIADARDEVALGA